MEVTAVKFEIAMIANGGNGKCFSEIKEKLDGKNVELDIVNYTLRSLRSESARRVRTLK